MITLPLKIGDSLEMVGWHSPHRLQFIETATGNTIILTSEKTKTFLKRYNLNANSIPGRHTQTISVNVPPKDWKRYERFKECADSLSEWADEVKSNWRDHLRYLRDEFNIADFSDEDIDGLDQPISNIKCTLDFIRTGLYPVADDEDEEGEFIDDEFIPSSYHSRPSLPPQPYRCDVKIEDISNGKLRDT